MRFAICGGISYIYYPFFFLLQQSYIFQAFLPLEKGTLQIIPQFEFRDTIRVKTIKVMKSGTKLILPKLESSIREYLFFSLLLLYLLSSSIPPFLLSL